MSCQPINSQDTENSKVTSQAYLYSLTFDPTSRDTYAYGGTLALGVGDDPNVRGRLWIKQTTGCGTDWAEVTNQGGGGGGGDTSVSFPKDAAVTVADIGKLAMNDGGVAKVYQLDPPGAGSPAEFDFVIGEISTVGTAAQNASIQLDFLQNPAENDLFQIFFNDGMIAFTFLNAPMEPTHVQIGATLADTLMNLEATLMGAFGPDVLTYVRDMDSFIFTAGTNYPGAAGNNYTLTIGQGEGMSMSIPGSAGPTNFSGGQDGMPASQFQFQWLTDMGISQVNLTSGVDWMPGMTLEEEKTNFLAALSAAMMMQYQPWIVSDGGGMGNVVHFVNSVTGSVIGNISLTISSWMAQDTNFVDGTDSTPALAIKTALGKIVGVSGGNVLLDGLALTRLTLSGAVNVGQEVAGMDDGRIRAVVAGDRTVGTALQSGVDGEEILMRFMR